MNFLLTLWLYAALLCPLWAYSYGFSDWSKNSTCKRPKYWSVHSNAPIIAFRGDVIVVVLLKASLPFSLTQASKIGRLRRRLRDNNITEVSYIIVNAQETASRDKYWDLKERAPPGVPVFQQDANKKDVWEIMGGELDDFLIYDRCGNLTFHIGIPWSYYFNPHVEAAIQATYQGNICNCSTTTSPVKAAVRQKVRIYEGIPPDYVFKNPKIYVHPPHS